jgi:hypothetical protein
MAAPGRAFDPTDSVRQGVKEFCTENKKELVTLLRDELKIDLAELVAVRDVPKETP